MASNLPYSALREGDILISYTNVVLSILYALMSVISFQVFLRGAGLWVRAGVVFAGEKTMLLNHEYKK